MSRETVNFVETLEYRRFAEFCDACRRYRYIGLCYGRSGVGKTLSARQYTRWDEVEACQAFPRVPLPILQALWESDAVFYTPRVVNSPHQIEREIEESRNNLRFIRWPVIDYDYEAQREELD